MSSFHWGSVSKEEGEEATGGLTEGTSFRGWELTPATWSWGWELRDASRVGFWP